MKHSFAACAVGLTIVACLAFAAGASANFNVTDEHTGQTFVATETLNSPYSCTVPCAFTFTPIPTCGSPSDFFWGVMDSIGQTLYTRHDGYPQQWHYDFPTAGNYSVVETENGSTCATGGTFKLTVLEAQQVVQDKTPPVTTLSGSLKQSIKRAHVVVVDQENEPSTVTATGSVSVPGVAKLYKLVRLTKKVDAGIPTPFSLRISRKALAAAKLAFASRKRVYANVVISATDTDGNTSSVKRRVRMTK